MIVIQREKVDENEDENQNQNQNDILVMLDTIVKEESIQEDKGTLFLFLIGFALLLILFFYIGKYILHK